MYHRSITDPATYLPHLGYFPNFKGLDAVLLSADSDGIRAIQDALSKWTVARSAASELGRLRIVRNCLTEANPWLCTGCPDIQHRLKLRRIVQRRETDGHNFWSSLATREQRRAAIGAKAASREPATASTNRVRLRRAGDRHVQHPHDEAGSERSATRALAVEAVAVERRNWRARAYIADRSACTPAGKWSSHIAVSSCRLTRFHWHLKMPRWKLAIRHFFIARAV